MKMEKIVKIAKRRGIIFPTAEVYGGTAGFFEYGPVGLLLKRKFEESWRDFFVKSEENIVEMEGCTILPEPVFEASGHLESFVDPIAQCKKCKRLHRADHLIKDLSGKFVEGLSCEELTKIIRDEGLKCPSCEGKLQDVKLFNLLLKTEIGPVDGQSAYLRPETAQNIFTDFSRVFGTMRAKLPFGIAQVGRSFRNEISPRHFIVRTREFNQMEIEMFLDPEKEDECHEFEDYADKKIRVLTRETQKNGGETIELTAEEAFEKGIIPSKWMAYFLAKEMSWFLNLGIPKEALRFRHMLPEETPHYSKGNFDLEIKFDFGWQESVGNALRSDYDLKQHMKHSGNDFSVMTSDGRKVVPSVVEPSFGVERPIAAVLFHCFREGEDRGWSWFEFPPKIAPYTAAVFPLVSKDGLPEKARGVYNQLRKCYDVYYDSKSSIGKLYARADEVGVPYAVTVDYQTLEDDSVTIRNRDNTGQIRVKIEDLIDTIWKLMNGEVEFEDAGELVE